MLDWLKFFPYARRLERKPVEIRGPYFSNLRSNKWTLNDCTLNFKAPRANHVFSLSGYGWRVKTEKPGSANILTTEWQRVYGGSAERPPSEWIFELFYSNEWCFVGPWFTGLQASLKATGLLVTAQNGSAFIDKNLFHPRVFETAIANYLDNRYGYYKNGRKPKYCGPLNWKILHISPSIDGVVYDIHEIGNGSREDPLLHRAFLFPITSQKFIYITFNFGGTRIFHDEIRSRPLFQLCDSIINSFRLNVGPETQAEWDKVKATCPDMSLTESFGELPWPLSMEKKPKNKKEVDITPRSVPQKLEQGR